MQKEEWNQWETTSVVIAFKFEERGKAGREASDEAIRGQATQRDIDSCGMHPGDRGKHYPPFPHFNADNGPCNVNPEPDTNSAHADSHSPGEGRVSRGKPQNSARFSTL